MQSVAGLRRAAKNIAHNYTDPQKKVREATSNDPWGPSSTLMSDIADLTYNLEAFAQIMEMLWKRLNDHGKNWRHVYKSLVLLEYLIKTGSERVGQQCKENIFAIQTLKDFQHFEDNKDQGVNVREKAKQLVVLLSSDEKLRNERTRALKARERFAQTISGFGSSSGEDGANSTGHSPVFQTNSFAGSTSDRAAAVRSRSNPELEQARPQTIGEEELQLQLALAMSKEEADQEEKRRRSDELRLQMALSQSEQEFKAPATTPVQSSARGPVNGSTALVDLLDIDLGFGGYGAPAVASGGNSELLGAVGGISPPVHHDRHQGFPNADPWNVIPQTENRSQDWNTNLDPWNSNTTTPSADPWLPAPTIVKTSAASPSYDLDFGFTDPREMDQTNGTNKPRTKTPQSFLGENSGLVNLDNLIKPTTRVSPVFQQQNPFSSPATGNQSTVPNPFQNTIQPKPTINDLRSAAEKQQGQGINFAQPSPVGAQGTTNNNNPWSPIGKPSFPQDENPFI